MDKVPTVEDLKEKMSPRMRKMYGDTTFTLTLYKAFPYVEAILMEAQRCSVASSNLETIAPTLMAMNRDLKHLELFALKGEEEASKSTKKPETTK